MSRREPTAEDVSRRSNKGMFPECYDAGYAAGKSRSVVECPYQYRCTPDDIWEGDRALSWNNGYLDGLFHHAEQAGKVTA